MLPSNIIHLNEIADERLCAYRDLTDHELRRALEDERGIFIAESKLVVERACACGVEFESMLVEESKLASCEALFAQLAADVPIYTLPAEEMSALAGYRVTRGVLAACRRPAPRDARELAASAPSAIVLEDLVDTTNVGLVFRSAAALGAGCVLLSPTCADPYSRRAMRVSMGTVLQVPWAYFEGPWPETAFSALEAAGARTMAMALDERAKLLEEVGPAPDEKIALFFGNEAYGLSKGVLERAGETVMIPMAHDVDSLNVAASAAVACWELFARGRVRAQ